MGIETGIGKKFMEELPIGIHSLFEGTPDIIRAALFGPNATLSTGTDIYSTAGEVSGGGYTAGGILVPLTIVGKSGSVRNAAAQFTDPYINPTDDATFTVAGVGVRGLMLYNVSQANRNIFTLDSQILPDGQMIHRHGALIAPYNHQHQATIQGNRRHR